MNLRIALFSLAALSLSTQAVPPPETGGHPASDPSATSSPDGKAYIAPASNEGAVAVKTFKFDPGLKVELWAAEPMLANPVSFAEDEHGRWFVAESYRQERGIEDNRAHGNWLDDDIASRTVEDRLKMIHKFYPDPKKFAEKFTAYEDRIVRVEDTTGSGLANVTSVVADGFREPLDGTGAGIIVRGDDVWYTCIPNLWHIHQQGEGKPALKEKLLTGFGVHYAFRGHDMHGLRFGPDGKLYFSIGDRGIHVQTKEGKLVDEPDTGSIMRCQPDGTEFEVFSNGVRNPQELVFDEFGNLFTGDNNSDSGDQARFTYLVEGGDCGWRMPFQYMTDRGPWNRERLWDEAEGPKARYIIPPVANLSNGPSGLTYNPGTGLSERYFGRFYLSDFRGGATASVVHEIALEPHGAFFKVKERRDFLAGCLSTDVEFGHDGSLYVLDWVASWSGVGKGRIYKFTDPAAKTDLQAQTKQLIEEGMSKRPLEELGGLLAHPDQRVRQAAQFELAARGGQAQAVLTAAAQKGATVLARLHGMWGLGQLAHGAELEAIKPLVALLDDPEAEVRAQAAHVLGDHRYPGAAEKFIALLKDPQPRPRQFAAMALAKLAHRPAVEPLFALLKENNDEDPVLRHAAVMGLTATATADELAAKKGDASTAVKIGALLALRRQKDAHIAAFLADPDANVVLEAARAIYDVPIEGAMPALAALISRQDLIHAAPPKEANPAVKQLAPRDLNLTSRILNANYRLAGAGNAVALAVFAADSAASENARHIALDALMNWGTPPARDRILNLYRPLPPRGPENAVAAVAATIPSLLKDGPPSVQETVAQMVARLNIQSGADSLFTLAIDPKNKTAPRVAAIQALATLKDPRLSQVARAAVSEKDSSIRTEGLRALAGSDPVAAVKLIGEVINTGTAVEKQGALAALSQIKRPEVSALLDSLMERLIAGGIAPEIQLDLLEATRKADTVELNAKLKQYEASLSASDPLAAYRVALAGGNAARGRKTFREKAETQCLRCHKCETGDSLVGPDLTHIGSKHDRDYLLESIVYPNKRIAEGFETVVLTLKDNTMVVGRLVKTEPTALQVETLDEKGKPKTVSVEIEKIQTRASAPSPMPENIRDFLSKSELRDLVEYLATRK